MKSNYIIPHWSAPRSVRAYCTTRQGGFSSFPFDSFNLGNHVGDLPHHVTANRNQLASDLNLSHQPIWVNQTHSKDVALLDNIPKEILSVDATITFQKHRVCVVLTADCLPILLCDRRGTQVAAIHAGWRGLASGIIFETLKKMQQGSDHEIIAWLGPAIGPSVFEIDEPVKESLSKLLAFPQNKEDCFKPITSKSGRYLANLYKIATDHLMACQVQEVTGGHYCTYTQTELFFSYRQSGGLTGRMASLIWMI